MLERSYVEDDDLIILKVVEKRLSFFDTKISNFYYIKQDENWYRHPLNGMRQVDDLNFEDIAGLFKNKGADFFQKEVEASVNWIEKHYLPKAEKINNESHSPK